MPFYPMKNGKKVTGRPRELDEERLKLLHSLGADDVLIARELGCTRRAVSTARARLGLPANRRPGGRGPGRWKGTYYRAVQEALQDPRVRVYLAQAVRWFRAAVDEHMAWAATLIERGEITHPVPGFAGKVENTTPDQAGRIALYEAAAARAAVVGVPGPAVLEMYRGREKYSGALMRYLAEQAVLGAGIVNEAATVEQVVRDGTRPGLPAEWRSLWREKAHEAAAWAEAGGNTRGM